MVYSWAISAERAARPVRRERSGEIPDGVTSGPGLRRPSLAPDALYLFSTTTTRNGAPWREPLSEDDAMTVDAKRLQAVFRMAIEAADPVQQAAVLDRECASDPEMRKRIE